MGEITLIKALDDYKTVYMPYRNFAERTREEYLNDLENFVGVLAKSGINHVSALALPIIERYVARLEQDGFASLTRKRKVVVIRSFLSFLYQDGYIDTNLGKRIVLPFAESAAPYILTPIECDQLRSVCANNPRDRAIVELLLQTGIKLSELIHLTLSDLELDETKKIGEEQKGFMRILGSRGKKERMLLLNKKACNALRSYLDVRENVGNGILFLNKFDEPLGERGVQKMLRKYLKRAEIRRASVHTLRHTFGAYHTARGASLKTLQEVMGHKDSQSTSIYLPFARGFTSDP